MTSRIFKLLAISAVLAGGFGSVSAAQTAEAQAVSADVVSNPFIKKRYSINGEWSVLDDDGQTQIRFSEDFNTKGGPDLKVFLSKTPIEDLNSKNAGNGSVSIGVLKSKSGGQVYTVPEDIDLSDYKSVIIQCEAFSVLWGGFDLPKTADAASLTPKP